MGILGSASLVAGAVRRTDSGTPSFSVCSHLPTQSLLHFYCASSLLHRPELIHLSYNLTISESPKCLRRSRQNQESWQGLQISDIPSAAASRWKCSSHRATKSLPQPNQAPKSRWLQEEQGSCRSNWKNRRWNRSKVSGWEECRQHSNWNQAHLTRWNSHSSNSMKILPLVFCIDLYRIVLIWIELNLSLANKIFMLKYEGPKALW